MHVPTVTFTGLCQTFTDDHVTVKLGMVSIISRKRVNRLDTDSAYSNDVT